MSEEICFFAHLLDKILSCEEKSELILSHLTEFFVTLQRENKRGNCCP